MMTTLIFGLLFSINTVTSADCKLSLIQSTLQTCVGVKHIDIWDNYVGDQKDFIASIWLSSAAQAMAGDMGKLNHVLKAVIGATTSTVLHSKTTLNGVFEAAVNQNFALLSACTDKKFRDAPVHTALKIANVAFNAFPKRYDQALTYKYSAYRDEIKDLFGDMYDFAIAHFSKNTRPGYIEFLTYLPLWESSLVWYDIVLMAYSSLLRTECTSTTLTEQQRKDSCEAYDTVIKKGNFVANIFLKWINTALPILRSSLTPSMPGSVKGCSFGHAGAASPGNIRRYYMDKMSWYSNGLDYMTGTTPADSGSNDYFTPTLYLRNKRVEEGLDKFTQESAQCTPATPATPSSILCHTYTSENRPSILEIEYTERPDSNCCPSITAVGDKAFADLQTEINTYMSAISNRYVPKLTAFRTKMNSFAPRFRIRFKQSSMFLTYSGNGLLATTAASTENKWFISARESGGEWFQIQSSVSDEYLLSTWSGVVHTCKTCISSAESWWKLAVGGRLQNRYTAQFMYQDFLDGNKIKTGKDAPTTASPQNGNDRRRLWETENLITKTYWRYAYVEFVDI